MPRRGLRPLAAAGVGLLLLAGCTGTPAATTDTSAVPTASASAAPTSGPATPSTGSATTGPSGGSTTVAPGSAVETSTVPAELTPLLASVSTEPVPVTGTDGAVYLVYELYLTNATTTRVTIDSVQALDSDSGAVLQTRSGAELVAHTRVVGNTPGSTAPSSVVLEGGQLAIVWVDPAVMAGQPVPTSVGHQVKMTFASAPNPLIPAELTETVATTQVAAQQAPVISPPLSGKNWFDGNGCCDEVTAHRGAANPINGQYFFAERFAIDWVQLDADRKLTTGDTTELSSYPYYGSPVHAVADGTIVAVSDELQDQTPGSNPPVGSLRLDQYGGNYVVEQFEQNGRTYYAFYAHLKPGTAKATVSVGRPVQAGDLVGELGNSGNTDSPHLHFHLMDGPDPLASNGLPFQLHTLQLVGQATGDAAVETVLAGRPLPLAPNGTSGTRTDAMPLYLDLVDLTAAGSPSTGASGAASGAASSGAASSGSASSGGASSESAPSGRGSSDSGSSGSSPAPSQTSGPPSLSGPSTEVPASIPSPADTTAGG